MGGGLGEGHLLSLSPRLSPYCRHYVSEIQWVTKDSQDKGYSGSPKTHMMKPVSINREKRFLPQVAQGPLKQNKESKLHAFPAVVKTVV